MQKSSRIIKQFKKTKRVEKCPNQIIDANHNVSEIPVREILNVVQRKQFKHLAES